MKRFKSISRAVSRGHLELTGDKFNVYVVKKRKGTKQTDVHLTIPKSIAAAMSKSAGEQVIGGRVIKTRRDRTVKHYQPEA